MHAPYCAAVKSINQTSASWRTRVGTSHIRAHLVPIRVMIDPNASDPFALASWRTNLLPTQDRAKLLWLMCSVLNVVYGWPFLEVLEAYKSKGRCRRRKRP